MHEAQRQSRGIASASATNFAMQVINLLLGLGVGVALGRLLGAEGLGVYAFAFSLARILGVLARLGLEPLLVREVAIFKQDQAWGRIAGITRWSRNTTLAAAAALGACAIGISWFTASDATFWTILWAMVFMAALSAASLSAGQLRGLGVVVASNVPILLLRMIALLVYIGVVAALFEATPPRMMAAHAAAMWTTWAVASVLWRRYRPAEVATAVPEVSGRAWLTAAVPLMVMGGLTVLNMQTDILMLKWLAGDAATGVYSVVAQLAQLNAMPAAVVAAVVSPRVAALYAAGDRAALQALIADAAIGVITATAALAAGLALIGRPVLALYSEAFVAGYAPLAVLVGCQLVAALAGVSTAVMVMSGHDREVGWVTGGTALLNAVLNALLIPKLGMLGAAIASGTATLVLSGSLALRVVRQVGVDPTAIPWFRARIAR